MRVGPSKSAYRGGLQTAFGGLWPKATVGSAKGKGPALTGSTSLPFGSWTAIRDGYLFVYNFLNLSDLLLNLSSRLFDVAFGFEFRIAGHFACRRFDSTLYLMCRTLNFV